MSTPLLIILPFLLLFGAACIRLYYIEIKIIKKLKVVDPNGWKRLIWWFGARAHPFRFRKFIKEPTTSDPYIKKYIAKYKRTMRFAIITWAILAIILISIMGLGMILNYTI